MTLTFAPRGATSKANQLIPSELQLQLFRMVDSQADLGLEMDRWQFFGLHRLGPDRVHAIHTQCIPARHEEHILEGFSLPVCELEAWILDYDHHGSVLTIADDYSQINLDC